MKNPPRIFIGPTEIAGYYGNLAPGFAQLGLPVTLVGATLHGFGYGAAAEAAWPARLYAACLRRVREASRPLGARLWRLPLYLAQAILFLWAAGRHDVFISGAGITLLPRNLDLVLLRWLGKTTICYVGHGSESRPPYLDGAFRAGDGTAPPPAEYRRLIAASVRRLARIERTATFTICSPLNAHFLRRRFINSHVFGVPFVPPAGAGETSPKRTGATRIFHAPSHRAAKGSDLIAGAIARLKAKGHAIDYRERSGVKNAVVLEEIAACDFVVDQAYSDFPLAGLATEAAFLGKPAIVGGYVWAELRPLIPADNWPPSGVCHPDELEAAIERWIMQPEACARAGAEAREFVHARWTSRQVAERYLRLVRGDFPAEWWRDPADTPFHRGGFAAESVHRRTLAQLVDAYGPGVLHVDDKPALRRALLKFAGRAPAAGP